MLAAAQSADFSSDGPFSESWVSRFMSLLGLVSLPYPRARRIRPGDEPDVHWNLSVAPVVRGVDRAVGGPALSGYEASAVELRSFIRHPQVGRQPGLPDAPLDEEALAVDQLQLHQPGQELDMIQALGRALARQFLVFPQEGRQLQPL